MKTEDTEKYLDIAVLIPKMPTAVLSTGLMILSFFSLISGVILDSISRLKLEKKRLIIYYTNL